MRRQPRLVDLTSLVLRSGFWRICQLVLLYFGYSRYGDMLLGISLLLVGFGLFLLSSDGLRSLVQRLQLLGCVEPQS